MIEGPDAGGACRLIALNRTLRAECERVFPMLEDAKRAATREEITEVVMRRMVAYGITANAAYQHGVTWESYASGLEGLPLYSIEDAFDRWDRGEGTKGDIVAAGFPPRPPQLALLAQQGKADIWTAAYRARKALDHVEKKGVEYTPAQRAAERQKMIDAGVLNPDGSVNFTPRTKGMPEPSAPRVSPQEMAAQMRARSSGVPISRHHIDPQDDDIGDVI